MITTPLPKLTIADEKRLRNFRTHDGSGIKDPARFKALMDEAVQLVEPGFHLGDNLFTWMRNVSPVEDSAFVEAWQSNVAGPADEATLWWSPACCRARWPAIRPSGSPTCTSQDAWFEARDYRVIPLPTGQGLVIKR